jgi:siroheme synthase
VAEVVQPLLAAGLAPHTPAAVISAAHTARQRHARCTLGTLVATLQADAALGSPAGRVIGEVAALGVESGAALLAPQALAEGVMDSPEEVETVFRYSPARGSNQAAG